MSYPEPDGFAQSELLVRKSRFIARAQRVADRHEAMAVLAQAKQDYPDARHHCWAYIVGDPGNAASMAANDDGEPAGTAGKPILNVLQHKGVGNIMLVVIRYFGGIKLGAGGLVRAYSQASEQLMLQLPLRQEVARLQRSIVVDFSQEQWFRHWLALHQGQVLVVEYRQQVQIDFLLPLPQQDSFVVGLAGQRLELLN